MKSNLANISIEDIGNKNEIKNFYPFTSRDATKKTFSSNELLGLIISHSIGKEIKKDFDNEKFITNCINKLREYIDDDEAVDFLKNIYFKENNLNLDSLLVELNFKVKNTSDKVFDIFRQLMNDTNIDISFESNLNFLENIILNEFKKELKPTKAKSSKSSYLPFLEKLFQNDLKFLNSNKHYFKKNIDNFLELYLFIYSSQLALNLQPIENALSIPSSKELYFILNHEKTSKERKKLEEFGYKVLYEKAKYIFPYLSLLTMISKFMENDNIRLYELENIFNDNDVDLLKNLNNKFREKRELSNKLSFDVSLREVLVDLFNSSYEQFSKGNNTRIDVFNKIHKAFEIQTAKPFLVNRGRAGKVLVLDQDKILLITNISIAEDKKIRFQDLLKRFEARGIYFDMKSQIELLNLYERIGNIERKSDSGDAVYVKTTI